MCDSYKYDHYFEISRDSLLRNAQNICAYVRVPVIGVVKCDGYGVSLKEAAHAWQAAGANMLAVSRPAEAISLRKMGFKEDILLLTPVSEPDILNALVHMRIILTVTGLECAQFYSRADLPVRVHVAVDTGMGRFGIRWTDLEQIGKVYETPNLIFQGIFSHFARAFEPRFCKTRRQLYRFLSVTQALHQTGLPVGIRHIAGSCAALRFPQTWLDAVRIGSALVGPLCVPVPIALESVGTFHARVLDRKCLLPGDTTGYGAIARVRHRTDALVISLGTETGFDCTSRPDRLRMVDFAVWLRNILHSYLHRPCVRFYGRPLPLIGRVGLQFTLFDSTGLDIRPGSYVQADVPLLSCSAPRVFH